MGAAVARPSPGPLATSFLTEPQRRRSLPLSASVSSHAFRLGRPQSRWPITSSSAARCRQVSPSARRRRQQPQRQPQRRRPRQRRVAQVQRARISRRPQRCPRAFVRRAISSSSHTVTKYALALARLGCSNRSRMTRFRYRAARPACRAADRALAPDSLRENRWRAAIRLRVFTGPRVRVTPGRNILAKKALRMQSHG